MAIKQQLSEIMASDRRGQLKTVVVVDSTEELYFQKATTYIKAGLNELRKAGRRFYTT